MNVKTIFLDETSRLRTYIRFGLFLAVVYISFYKIGTIISFLFPEKLVDFLLPRGMIGMISYRFITLLVLATIVLIFRKIIDRKSILSIGFGWPEKRLGSSLVIGFCAGAVPIILCTLALLAFGYITPYECHFSKELILLLIFLIIAAFNEEIVFRGYLLRNMLDIDRPVWGIIISSVLFWLLHSFNPSVWENPISSVNLFLAGVILAMVYVHSGNIWFPTLFHMAWNYFQGPVFGLPISGMPFRGLIQMAYTGKNNMLITGGNFGLEGSLLLTLSLLGGIAIYIILLKETGSFKLVIAEKEEACTLMNSKNF